MRPKKPYRTRPIPVKLDDFLLIRVEKASARLGEAKSTVMRMAMRLGLDQVEKLLVQEIAQVKLFDEPANQFKLNETAPSPTKKQIPHRFNSAKISKPGRAS